MGLDPEPYPSDSSRKVPQSHQLPKPTLCRCHRGRCWGRGPGVWIGICYFGRSLKINGNFSQWPFQEPKLEVPSGKLTVCELERSTMLLMGKSTISMVIFNSYVKLPEGIIYNSRIYINHSRSTFRHLFRCYYSALYSLNVVNQC